MPKFMQAHKDEHTIMNCAIRHTDPNDDRDKAPVNGSPGHVYDLADQVLGLVSHFHHVV